MALTKEQILAINDLDGKIVPVEVPGWPGAVCVRTMSGRSRDRYEALIMERATVDLRPRLLVYTICDEAGNLLFDESEMDTLNAKDFRSIDALFSVAMKLNGIDVASGEETVKNSGAVPSASTATGSPASEG